MKINKKLSCMKRESAQGNLKKKISTWEAEQIQFCGGFLA
jgi:hypothetical protein